MQAWQMTLEEFASSELDHYSKCINANRPSSIFYDPMFQKRLPRLKQELKTIPKNIQLKIFIEDWRGFHTECVENAIARGDLKQKE
jgi:hypothetical protein